MFIVCFMAGVVQAAPVLTRRAGDLSELLRQPLQPEPKLLLRPPQPQPVLSLRDDDDDDDDEGGATGDPSPTGAFMSSSPLSKSRQAWTLYWNDDMDDDMDDAVSPRDHRLRDRDPPGWADLGEAPPPPVAQRQQNNDRSPTTLEEADDEEDDSVLREWLAVVAPSPASPAASASFPVNDGNNPYDELDLMESYDVDELIGGAVDGGVSGGDNDDDYDDDYDVGHHDGPSTHTQHGTMEAVVDTDTTDMDLGDDMINDSPPTTAIVVTTTKTDTHDWLRNDDDDDNEEGDVPRLNLIRDEDVLLAADGNILSRRNAAGSTARGSGGTGGMGSGISTTRSSKHTTAALMQLALLLSVWMLWVILADLRRSCQEVGLTCGVLSHLMSPCYCCCYCRCRRQCRSHSI